MSAKSGKKKSNPIGRRIPENPRYKHVKPTVDTGASMRKYLEHLEDIKKNYKYRKDEIFSRLKVSTFAQLVLQVTDMWTPDAMDSAENEDKDVDGSPQHSPPSTARSTLSSDAFIFSVVTGTGELDTYKEPEADVEVVHQPPVCPYLLLDLRDKDDYDKCHIISARCYPATMLSRSCNYFTQDILEYKNKAGRIIILYDEDERIAPQAATVFIQRGVDNAFMLSGGMKVLYKTFPIGTITGQVPVSCLPSPTLSARKPARTPSSGALQRSAQPLFQHKESFTPEDKSLESSRSCSAATATSRSISGASIRTVSTKPWK
eukprot:Em0001g1110a